MRGLLPGFDASLLRSSGFGDGLGMVVKNSLHRRRQCRPKRNGINKPIAKLA
jgi:hypothetical protein